MVAGGASRRMERDKALLPWNTTDLLGHALGRLAEVSEQVRILAGPECRYADRGVPLVTDASPGTGPLAGILAGLDSAAERAGLFLAVDLPLVPSAWLARLLELGQGFDAVVPSSTRGPEPLCALYGPRCREPIRRQLAAGSFRVSSFWREVRLRLLRPEELASREEVDRRFQNLNAPEDYAMALRWAAADAASR